MLFSAHVVPEEKKMLKKVLKICGSEKKF